MAQQINLHSPILLAPSRVFSAVAMVRALALLVAALAAIGGWSQWRTLAIRAELARATATWQAEKRQLDAALAQTPASDAAALDQRVAQARTRLVDRQTLLHALSRHGGDAGAGRHSELLKLLARTVPAPLWLTEVKRVDSQLELAGTTLQPEALQPWLALLAADAALTGQTLAAVKVERSADADGWQFRVVSRGAPR